MNSNVSIEIINKKLPGDIAMWFFILAELSVFGVFFISFAVTEQLHSELFREGKSQLHTLSGLINTLALITSSLFVALSVQALKHQKAQQTVLHIAIALAFACVYLVVKGWEYNELFKVGIDLETNTFFTLYFLITAFHFLHVILGMVILVFVAIKAWRLGYQTDISGFESGASYWHMVDLVWIILFPLIYVI